MLHYAVYRNDLNLVKLLVNNSNIDINAKSSKGTALQCAVNDKIWPIVAYLNGI